MAKSGVIDRDLGWKDIKKELEKLSGMGVKVGIVEGDTDVSGTEKRIVGGKKVSKKVTRTTAEIAEYGYYNEVGTEHIPSRPFLRSAVDNNQEKINKMMDSAYRHVVNGQWTAEDAMKRIGENGVSIVQGNFRKGSFVPDSAETIATKGSSQVLIDTGILRNAVNYAVVKDGQIIARGERKDKK